MPDPNHFSPVILYSDDAKAVHDALVASGHTELAQKIRRKASRSRLDRMYIDNLDIGSDDEFDYDDEPVVAQSSEGAYVMVWHWIPKGKIRKKICALSVSKRPVKS